MEFRFFERRDRFSERLQRFPGVEAGGRTLRKAGVELKKEAPPVAEPDDEAAGTRDAAAGVDG